MQLFEWPAGRARAPLTSDAVTPDVVPHGGMLTLVTFDGVSSHDLASGAVFPAEKKITVEGWPFAARFSADGATLLLTGNMPSVKQWDWRTGRLAGPDLPSLNWTFAEYVRGTPWAVTAQSNRGELGVHFWDAATAQRVAPGLRLAGHEMKGLRVSPDGRLAFVSLIRPMLGFGVLDLAAMHDAPAFSDADLAQLARLNAGGTLREGAFIKFTGPEFLREWRDFRARHPAWQRLKP